MKTTGNPGNRGGGRKPLYLEIEEAREIKKAWKGDTDRKKLLKKINSGVHSLRDMYIYKGLAGNEVILRNIADKILPDKIDIHTDSDPATHEDLSAALIRLRAIEAKKNAPKS